MRPTLDAGGLKWATCYLAMRGRPAPPSARCRPPHTPVVGATHALPSPPIAPPTTAPCLRSLLCPACRFPTAPPPRRVATHTPRLVGPCNHRSPRLTASTPPCERNLSIAGTTAMSRLICRAPPSPSGTTAHLLPSNYKGLFFRSNYQDPFMIYTLSLLYC